MKKEKNLIGVLCVVVCEVIFGFSFLFTKKITASVSPMNLLSWRFIFAFLILNICVLAGIIKVNFKDKAISSLFWLAIFHPVLYFIGETLGINLTTASESGTIIASIPIITLLFSALILKKLPGKLQVIGVSITTTGIIIMVLTKGLEATFNPMGYLMLLLAVISYGMYSVFAEKAIEFTSAEKTYAMLAFGAVAFTVIALVQNTRRGTLHEFLMLPFTSPDFLLALLYLSVGSSVVAFLLYNMAIDYIGLNRAASFAGLSTIVTVIAGIVILQEKFSTLQSLGTALVLGGVYLANVIPKGTKSYGLYKK